MDYESRGQRFESFRARQIAALDQRATLRRHDITEASPFQRELTLVINSHIDLHKGSVGPMMTRPKGHAMSIRDDLQNLLNIYVAAYQAGDAAACAAVFAPNGELHSPYAPPARGRAAIAALHEVWTEAGGDGKQLTVIDDGGSGDLAWCLASFSEGQVTGSGTSLNIFERHADGKWLVRISSLNSNDPVPGT
jgi:ketosteroid isomerase-like protein